MLHIGKKYGNNLDDFVQLRYEDRHLIKTEWQLDVSNLTHGIELGSHTINDVNGGIFAYATIQNEDITRNLWKTTNALPTTMKPKVVFSLCLFEASLANVATCSRSMPDRCQQVGD